VACLYVSHRLEEVLGLAQRITVLRDGRLAASAPRRAWTRTKLAAAMVGREVKERFRRPAGGKGAPLLQVRDWSVRSRVARPALEKVSFELRPGEVLGVSGLMGSGRTALLSSLFGCSRTAVSGEMNFAGQGWCKPCASPSEALNLGICLVSEDRKRQGLVLQASILENLGLAVLKRFAPAGWLNWGELRKKAQGQAQGLSIKAAGLDAPATSLSGGNQQKVVLGKWFLAGPKVLLLDEPTRGIDVGAKAEIYALIRRWASEGMGVILASSELPEVLGLSNRILVLSQGRQTALLDARKATAEKVMQAAVS
jgi:D-xylose transport system ATP-binding protein